MGKVKKFDEKSVKNRERVRKHRNLKKKRLLYQNQVRKRIYSMSNHIVEQLQIDDNSENIEIERRENQEEKVDKMNDFELKLKYWAVNHRISGRAISDLLAILIFAGFTFLPKDSRTFMRTPTNVPIKILSKGKMWYTSVMV